MCVCVSTQCVLEVSTGTTAQSHAVLDVTGRVIQQMATVNAEAIGRSCCVKVNFLVELKVENTKLGAFKFDSR